MRVINLRAENIKRLVAVDITPDSNTVVISGRNGHGKTSVLDAIWFALGGGKAQADTPRPIRDGEDHAEVRLDLGDLYIVRKWKGEKSTLHVTAADGAKYSSPQTMLDGLIGRLSFDPLAFAQAPPKEQLATLLDLVDLPFDIGEVDAKRAGVFDRRTDVNREVKQLQARLDAMPRVDGVLPATEISAAQVLAEMRDAQALVGQHDEAQRRRAALEAEVDRLAEALEKAEQDLRAAQQLVEALGDLPDVDAIQSKLDRLEETNRAVRGRNARAETGRALAAAVEKAESLTQELAAIDATKEQAIAAAAMPIEGLGFDEDGVTYLGVPFAQCSGAEKLRVSLAMAMAVNPQVRVIRITDGSLLDDDGMRLVAEMAAERDFQVWIERVGDGGEVGILIEDGMVAGAPVPEPAVEAF